MRIQDGIPATGGVDKAAQVLYLLRKASKMITGFRDRDTVRFFQGQDVRKFRGFAKQAVRKLTMLDNAETLGDLAGLSGNRLESLRGDRNGQYSIRINGQWRLCFRWGEAGPYDVQIVDYHR